MAKADRPGGRGGRLNSGHPPEKQREIAKLPRKLPEIKDVAAEVLGADDGSGLTIAQKIFEAHAKKAIEGDKASADLVFGYAYGKPTQRTEHSGNDGGPLALTLLVQPVAVDLQTDD